MGPPLMLVERQRLRIVAVERGLESLSKLLANIDRSTDIKFHRLLLRAREHFRRPSRHDIRGGAIDDGQKELIDHETLARDPLAIVRVECFSEPGRKGAGWIGSFTPTNDVSPERD